MIVLHCLTVVCPRLLTVGASVLFVVSVLSNLVRCHCPCNVFDMIVLPSLVHCYLLTSGTKLTEYKVDEEAVASIAMEVGVAKREAEIVRCHVQKL